MERKPEYEDENLILEMSHCFARKESTSMIYL